MKHALERILYLSLIIISMSSALFADKFKIQIDDAYFFEPDSNLYRWEMYYTFDESELKFNEIEQGMLGELFFDVQINSTIQTEYRKRWIVSHQKSNSQSPVSMIGQKDFYIAPGQYEVDIYIQDFNDSTSFNNFKFPLLVIDKNHLPFFISSPEAAQVIQDIKSSQIKWNKSFIKGENYIVPHPSLIYNAQKQNLYSYFEIYSKDANNELLNLSWMIKDNFDRIVFNSSSQIEMNDKKIETEIRIPLIEIPSGSYMLHIQAVLEQKLEDTVSMSKKVFVFNSDVRVNKKPKFIESMTFEHSEFSTLTPKQTDIEIEKIKPLSSEYELEQFSILTTTEAKQRMLYRFWKSRDLDSVDNFNESLLTFKESIKYAENYFSYGMTPGWRTDRGRVITKYGIPGERQIHPQRGDLNPYESWFYEDIQGGINFYFVDFTGYGNYTLVHSTAYGELQYENWYNEYVKKNTGQLQNNENDYINPGW